jgi:hypothetical protein
MMLDVAMTVQEGAKDQKITRDDILLLAPDGTAIPMLTREGYFKNRGPLEMMEKRANESVQTGDSVNYFPPKANIPCHIEFFADPGNQVKTPTYDELELNSDLACVGRLYFHVPGGIQYGNYNLDVQFANSVVRVPMKIMTKEEAKEFEQQWKAESKKYKHKGHDH